MDGVFQKIFVFFLYAAFALVGGCTFKGRDALVNRFLVAYNRGDVAATRECFHQESLAQLESKLPIMAKPFVTNPGGLYSIPGTAKISWTSVTPNRLRKEKFSYNFLIDPTDEVTFEWEGYEGREQARSLYAVRNGGRWVFIAPVPNERVMEDSEWIAWMKVLEEVYNPLLERTP